MQWYKEQKRTFQPNGKNVLRTLFQ